jgi:hypothetical protein
MSPKAYLPDTTGLKASGGRAPLEVVPACRTAAAVSPAQCGSGAAGSLYAWYGQLTRSNSLTALAQGEPLLSAGIVRFSIGLKSQEGATYQLHLSEAEAERFAAFFAEHRKGGA